MRNRLLWVILLPVLLLIFFHDVTFTGRSLSTAPLLPGTAPDGPYGFSAYRPTTPFSLDIAGNAWVNEPNPYIIKNAIKDGDFPLWNPHEGLGMPIVGNVNTEVFNFLKVFLHLSPGPFPQDMFYILRLLVMGLFTYLFLREKKLSSEASFFGASFFMLSGYSLWWINLHPLSTVMYLPPAFYFYERWSNKKDLLSPFLLALSICMSIFGGKFPDVVMGLSLLSFYAVIEGSLRGGSRGLFSGAGRVIVAVSAGVLLSAVVLLPFLELYSHASPMAKAVRTGAASHTLPLISSISLWQPFFLGWENYYYAQWLQKEFLYLLPYAGIVILLHVFYVALNPVLIRRTLPFALFFLFLFMQIYGLLPSFLIVNRPLFGSMNFIKYNSMLFFSLAVMSAYAFESIIAAEKSKERRFYAALMLTAALISFYFLLLWRMAPSEFTAQLAVILGVTLACLAAAGAVHHYFKGRYAFRIIMISAMLCELFIYMPKDRPERFFPYNEPPYMEMLKEPHPYRIIGDGAAVPPLVSSAIGLYDSRGIDILMPRDYYSFFQHLIGFSVPYTSDPDALVAGTSPWTDLIGVRFILSKNRLDPGELDEKLRYNITSLRWIRLFESMVSHRIGGRLGYGIEGRKGDMRFSFSFPRKFIFSVTMKVTQPFFFAGFMLQEAGEGGVAKVRVTLPGKSFDVALRDGDGWNDRFIDVSAFSNRIITVTMEGIGEGEGRVSLGSAGPSPGRETESHLFEKLMALHSRETALLEYKGEHAGLHIYENMNVMERAFILHETKYSGGIESVIEDLLGGLDFRKVALVSADLKRMPEKTVDVSMIDGEGRNIRIAPEEVFIRKYSSQEIEIEAASNGGMLVLSDIYYPGWKAKVNGKDAEVVKVFGLLRGVVIGSGKSVINFSYRPLSFYAGAAISLSALAVFLLLIVFASRKRRGNA